MKHRRLRRSVRHPSELGLLLLVSRVPDNEEMKSLQLQVGILSFVWLGYQSGQFYISTVPAIQGLPHGQREGFEIFRLFEAFLQSSSLVSQCGGLVRNIL